MGSKGVLFALSIHDKMKEKVYSLLKEKVSLNQKRLVLYIYFIQFDFAEDLKFQFCNLLQDMNIF